MKKISLLLILAILAFALLSGCRSSSSIDASSKVHETNHVSREDFELHLLALAEEPEYTVDLDLKYNRTKNLEDAFTKLYCYLYEEDDVSWNEADDAWIYVSHYIDALHAEIADLYEEYQYAY